MVSQYRLHQRKNGYFYHRVKVPVDIRTLYGKEIEQVSLCTRDHREAVRRLPAVIVETDQRFSRLRGEYAAEIGSLSMHGMTEKAPVTSRLNIKRIADLYAQEIEAQEVAIRAEAFKDALADLRSFVRRQEIPPQHEEYIDHLEQEGDPLPVLGFIHRLRLEKRMASVKRSRSVGDFEAYFAAVDRHAPHTSPVDRPSMIKAMIDAELRTLEAWHEEPELVAHPQSGPRRIAHEEPTQHRSSVSAIDAEPDLPLMSVIARECYAEVGKEKNWSAKTEAARHTQIKQFLEICGDKPLNQYTQQDIRDLKVTLRSLPPQAHGKKQFKGMTKAQIAEKARELGMEGLSTESVRQIMTSVSMVFGWARTERRTSLVNIVQPMIPLPSTGGNKRDKRHGFTSEELQRLFSAPVFSGVKSEADWFQSGDVSMHHTGRFWVPLLALYAGARLMEAVQLVREDIGCEGGIWFLDINEDDEDETGKRVKNESSIRRIPVHPELVRLGFLKFVETVPVGSRLFPDIAIGPDTQRHRHASKMFNKLLAVMGVKGPKKVWHSLRHSFEQACRDSRVDSAVMDQLQGHSQKGMRANYGEGYKLPELYEGILSIRYMGLDLSHVLPIAAASNRHVPPGIVSSR